MAIFRLFLLTKTGMLPLQQVILISNLVVKELDSNNKAIRR
jgi:hypothetical protein